MLEGGGGFLTLPLDGFKLLDRRGTQRVHVGLPFMLLCLLSQVVRCLFCLFVCV